LAKRKNNFAKKYRSLTDLGGLFNMSAIAVGKKLIEFGVRNTDGSPTEKSLEEGLAVSTPLKNGTPHFRWHFHRCRELLIQNGIKPDQSHKIRKTLKSMLSLYKSEAMETGGGLEYKFAINEFFELAESLPVQSELDNICRMIEELKTNKEVKNYFCEILYVRLAEKFKPDSNQIKTLLSTSSFSVLSELSKNPKVDEFTRVKAKAEADKVRPQLRT